MGLPLAPLANRFAWRASSAFCCTAKVNSSTQLHASSMPLLQFGRTDSNCTLDDMKRLNTRANVPTSSSDSTGMRCVAISNFAEHRGGASHRSSNRAADQKEHWQVTTTTDDTCHQAAIAEERTGRPARHISSSQRKHTDLTAQSRMKQRAACSDAKKQLRIRKHRFAKSCSASCVMNLACP